MRKGQATPEYVKKKISETKKKKYASGEYDHVKESQSKTWKGKHLPEKTKKKISSTLIRKYESGELDHVKEIARQYQLNREWTDEERKHCSEAHKGIHWKMSDEGKKSLRKPKSPQGKANIKKACQERSKRMKERGYIHPRKKKSIQKEMEKAKRKKNKNISDGIKKSYMSGRKPAKGIGIGKTGTYITKDNQHLYYRSSWEKLMMSRLDNIEFIQGEDYIFEGKRFNLGPTSYMPDFYFPFLNLFVEIKGYISKDFKEKLFHFKRIYTKRIIVLSSKNSILLFLNIMDDIKSRQLQKSPTSFKIGNKFLTIFEDHNSDNPQPIQRNLEGSETNISHSDMRDDLDSITIKSNMNEIVQTSVKAEEVSRNTCSPDKE